MKEVWALTCDTPGQKIVLLALADCERDNAGCWPSISTLAAKCSMSRQGVLNQLDALEKRGWISREKGNGKSSHYSLTLPVHAMDYSPGPKHAFQNGSAHARTRPHTPAEPVQSVDQSSPLTSPESGHPAVHSVDHHQSTQLTGPVHRMDSNRNEPKEEPKIESAEALLVFQCNGKVKEWALTREKLSEWEESFPQTDVMACCRKALQWTRDNGKKTAQGMTKFLGGWIGRAADKRECPRTQKLETEEWVTTKPLDYMAMLKQSRAEEIAQREAEEGERWI